MMIKVVTLGDVPTQLTEEVLREVNRGFEHKFALAGKAELPQEAFVQFREQYRGEDLLDLLENSSRMVGIVSEDIFAQKLNYVFGLAKHDGPAIVSIKRLDNKFYDKRPAFGSLVERTVKEIIHEVGHSFGVEHCYNPTCVMSLSQSVDDVDKKTREFCSDCKLKMAMKGVKI